MAKKDFVISYYAQTPFLKAMLDQLETPYVFFQPDIKDRKYKEYIQGKAGGSVLGLWDLARGPSDTLGRVAVIGFSEGCQGVRATLECKDASAIDAVIPIDGIHTQKVGPVLDMSFLAPYVAYGQLAAQTTPSIYPGTKLLAITHSSIGSSSLPLGLASTTETGEVIWNAVTKSAQGPIETAECIGGCPAATNIALLSQIVWPNGFPVGTKVGPGVVTDQGWTTIRPSAPETGFLPAAPFTWSGFADGWNIRRVANNMYILGWSYDTPNRTKDPTGNRDHIFQANMVLPYVALELLVRRWNPTCTPGLGFGAPQTCTKTGQDYFDQDAKPLPDPFALGIPLPRIAAHCPPPPPGHVIIGREGDPCWSGAAPSSATASAASSTIGQFIVSAAGVAAGWYGARFAMKEYRKVKHKRT